MTYRKLFIGFFLTTCMFSCFRKGTDGVQLLFWCSNNNQEIVFSTRLTNQWNQAHPDHSIHLQPVPEGQSSEEVILAAVVGKTTPDIYANMWQGNVEMYAKAGSLIALDTLEGFMEFIRDRCNEKVMRQITSSDGHIYQIPWKVNPIMTLYNKDLYVANGITSPPKSYNDFLKDARVFKERNNGAVRFGYTEVSPLWYQRLFNYYTLYIAASGGAPLIADNRAAFDNKYSVEVFRFLQALYKNDYFSKEGSGASGDLFVEQKIGTKWTGPWEISYLNNFPDRGFSYDYYPPVVPVNTDSPVYTYSDPKNIVIFSNCTRPQEAWEFIKTLIDKEGDRQLLKITGQLPQRRNLESDAYFEDYFAENPMMATFARQIPYLKGIDNCEAIVEVLDIISQEYEACVIYDKKSPEAAIADAAKAVNVLLKNAD